MNVIYFRHSAQILAILGITLVIAACDWRSPASGSESSSDSTTAKAFCTAEFSDSVKINDAVAYQNIIADFPAEDDSSRVAQAALEWLCNEVRGRCFPDYIGEKIDSAFTVGNENTTFAENVVDTYGRKGLQRMAADLKEFADEGFEGFMANNLTIELVENKPEYITYTLEHDIYTGGAHGAQYHKGLTFRTSDGATFNWALFDKTKRAELIQLLKNGLMAYFNQGAEEPISTDSALFEMLMLYDDPDTPENELEFGLPLPATAPWITSGGFVFIYQEYEIAAYAFGRPEVTLPFNAVAPYLTEAGRKFISFD